MKKRSVLSKLWSVVYPPLICAGVQIAVAITVFLVYFAIVLMPRVFNATEMSTPDIYDFVFDSVGKLIMPIMTLYSLAALVPFILIFKSERLFYPENPQKISFSVYIMIFVLGLFSNIYCSGLIVITNLETIFPVPNDFMDSITNPDSVFLTLLTAGVLVPIIEELCFRGIIFKRARNYFGVPAGVIISALLFGIFHGNMLQFIYASVFGCLLAMVYHRSGNIMAPILLHMGFNSFAIIFSQTEYLSVISFIFSGIAVFLMSYLILVKVPFNRYQKNTDSLQ